MQWSAEPHGGFTRSNSPILPIISEGPYSYEHVNVAQQRRNPNSLLNWTERIIRMRKEVAEIGWGDFTVIPLDTPQILILRYKWRNNVVVIVHNLGHTPREISLDLDLIGENGRRLINLLSDDHSYARKDGQHRILLEPYGYRWFRAGGLDYLLKRGEI